MTAPPIRITPLSEDALYITKLVVPTGWDVRVEGSIGVANIELNGNMTIEGNLILFDSGDMTKEEMLKTIKRERSVKIEPLFTAKRLKGRMKVLEESD